MARKVFFSFHYTRDSHRVAQIRNSNVLTQNYLESTFLDRAAWESIKRNGRQAIQNWIDTNMSGTSVVVLCFGLETYTRPWVKYELQKAHREGKGIVAIDMAGMKNLRQDKDGRGPNPLLHATDSAGTALYYYDMYKTYSWLDALGNEYGRYLIDDWIELAAKLAGRP
jgi:hypothetical protein